MAILAVDLMPLLDKSLNILFVALGLGLVIFFHELGHFAVAKWCGVAVERFSIGFGPILWSRKRGETEYALSAIPFGGYVKMLGQDDLDPSQLSSEEIAQDPRSYSAKPVWQRMAIISAGVVMNVITGMLFFAFAFQQGVNESPSVLGSIQTGMPAWKAGLHAGDRLTQINGREAQSFADIMRGVALTSDEVTLEGVHADGTTFEVKVTPDESGNRRKIGAAPAPSLTLIGMMPGENTSAVAAIAGTPAAEAQPSLLPGDKIIQVDGQRISTVPELQGYLARHRSEAVVYHVEREGESQPVEVLVAPNRFRTLGLSMDVGQITAIQKGSAAARQQALQVGDKITKVDGKAVGTEINPLVLPTYFGDRHGQIVQLEVSRPTKNGDSEKLSLEIVPDDRPGWSEPLSVGRENGLPLDVPALGVAFHLIPTVLKVEEDSPAAAAGIPRLARLKHLELVLPKGEKRDLFEELSFEFNDKSQNWATAFWLMQQAPKRTVRLTVITEEGEIRKHDLAPQVRDDWFVPSRGALLGPLVEQRKADSFVAAVGMGFTHTRNSMVEIYGTLRNLFNSKLSVKEIHGPVGIAKVAYQFADQGVAALSLFLGFLSINLAVLNFLPIPVLDGGHMCFLIWEAVTRRRPTEKVVIAATYCGMIFVLCLMGLVIYLDLFVHS